tara:strand:+ start:49 stop:588 length:540 start_codon:yes stop_codon:yes gene_type:complete
MCFHRIIDDFLNEHDMHHLEDYITSQSVDWKWNNTVACDNEPNKVKLNNWYFTSTVYIDHNIIPEQNDLATVIDPILFRLMEMEDDNGIPELRSLIRIKANLFPHTNELVEHMPHRDYRWPCKGGLFSINTCDGFTRLGEDIKVQSVRNRLLLFNSEDLHNSTTTTNSKSRLNINMNYL